VAKPKHDVLLEAIPLFAGLSKRQLKKVAAIGEIVEYLGGASVVREGDIGDSFFVVLSGQGKVTVNGRVVHRVLPGDHFGEVSLLDGGPRTASVVAETPMNLLMIARAGFNKILRADPQLALALLESLARMIRRVDRSLAR
jgi:CRP/FNR family cyclic AMP-dependent transcriptional regulator